jgi:hypothetical protein
MSMNSSISICSQCGLEYNADMTINSFLDICNECQLNMGLISEEDLKNCRQIQNDITVQ